MQISPQKACPHLVLTPTQETGPQERLSNSLTAPAAEVRPSHPIDRSSKSNLILVTGRPTQLLVPKGTHMFIDTSSFALRPGLAMLPQIMVYADFWLLFGNRTQPTSDWWVVLVSELSPVGQRSTTDPSDRIWADRLIWSIPTPLLPVGDLLSRDPLKASSHPRDMG